MISHVSGCPLWRLTYPPLLAALTCTLIAPRIPHASTARAELSCALAGNRIKITLALRSDATPAKQEGGWTLSAWSESTWAARAHTHPLPSGTFSRIFSTSSCFRMWRAIEPEPLAEISGRVPRCLRPPNTFLKAPTPAPPRMYTRRAIAAARDNAGHKASAQDARRGPSHRSYSKHNRNSCIQHARNERATASASHSRAVHTCTDVVPVWIIGGQLLV
eukprot:scaffold3572_cov125-Isochrysis_galbana.AAC.8